MNIELTPQESSIILASFNSLYRDEKAPDDLKAAAGPLWFKLKQGLQAAAQAEQAMKSAQVVPMQTEKSEAAKDGARDALKAGNS